MEYSTVVKFPQKYSDAQIADRARKFTRLFEFMRKDKAAYQIALKRGLVPTFTWLRRNIEAASRHYKDAVYVYEFPETKTAYVGRTIEPKNRHKRHRWAGDPVYEYAKAQGVDVPPMKILCDGFGVKTGATKECEKIEEYKQNGWTLLNKAKGGGLGQIGNGWVTYKKCMDTARKYEYVQDFLKDYPYMYDKMRWHGWIKECTWFKYRHAKDGTYSKASKEEIAKIASKFKTRNEFQLGAKQAYKVTLKHGWMDDFFPRGRSCARRVGKFDRNTGDLLEIYETISEAAVKNSGKASNARSIGRVCARLKQRTYKGFIYRYLDKDNNPTIPVFD